LKEATSEFLCWMYRATTHARSLKSKDGSLISLHQFEC
jgi:hypothetical protein